MRPSGRAKKKKRRRLMIFSPLPDFRPGPYGQTSFQTDKGEKRTEKGRGFHRPGSRTEIPLSALGGKKGEEEEGGGKERGRLPSF